MKKQLPNSLILTIGLFMLSASLLVKHFVALPDFADGMLIGVAIGIIGIASIRQLRAKRL